MKTLKVDGISEDYFDALKDRLSHSTSSSEGLGSAKRKLQIGARAQGQSSDFYPLANRERASTKNWPNIC